MLALPPVLTPVRERDVITHVWCVHSSSNHVFTLAPKPERRSIVSFVSADDAARVSDMINMHVEITRELPFVQHGDVLRLPSTKVSALHAKQRLLAHVFVERHAFEDLRVKCLGNGLDMLVVKHYDDDERMLADLLTFERSHAGMCAIFDEKMH